MPPKNKTAKYISSGREWVDVCTNCPLKKCVEDSGDTGTCPIRVAKEKEIAPPRMVEIEQMAGLKQPIKFRDLVFTQGIR